MENPDPAAHKAGTEPKVSLVGMIDGNPVKRVAEVPVKVLIHSRSRGEVAIPYVLKQGVCFEHSVEGVPTFCLDHGTTVKMPVKKAAKEPRPRKQRNERAP